MTSDAAAPQAVGRRFFSYLEQRELDAYPTGRLRWWLIGLVVLGWTVEQFESLKLGPVLVYVFDEFDVGLREWGRVLLIALFARAFGAYWLGGLADRYGRRQIMIWPVLLYTMVAAGIALAGSFWLVAALSVCGGFLVAGMSPAVHAALRDITPQMGRGMAYAWISLAFTLGALLSNWVAAATLPIWPGWRPQMWIAVALALVTGLVLLIFYRDLSPRLRARAESHAISPAAHREGARVYRDWRLWMLSGAMLFWAIPYATVSAYVPTYLVQRHGLPAATSSAVTGWFWLVFTGSVLVSGILSDRLRLRKPISAFGGMTTGACFLLAAGLPAETGVLALSLVWAAAGLFAGFIYPAWCALLSENAEALSAHGVARAFGMASILQVLAGVALSEVLPPVVLRFGWSGWLAACGGSCLVIAFLVAFGRGPWLPTERPA